jgi:hypothetical protein
MSPRMSEMPHIGHTQGFGRGGVVLIFQKAPVKAKGYRLFFSVNSLVLFSERLQTRFFPVESPESGENRENWRSTPAQNRGY